MAVLDVRALFQPELKMLWRAQDATLPAPTAMPTKSWLERIAATI
jgi:hypothetical protein